MTIKTLLVNSEVEPKLLRNSIFRLLSWLQRTALVLKGHYTLKSSLEQGILFTYETNRKLINYYLMNRCISEYIKPIIGKYDMNDTIGDEIFVTKKTDDVYILMVKIKHRGHNDLVPLLSLEDP